MLLTVVSHFFLEGVYFSSTKPNQRTLILSSNTERLPISPKRKQSSKPWITALHRFTCIGQKKQNLYTGAS